ncbi:MAG TPA: hypothetical protein VKV73_04195 [Chloroflexota bacterium]|nr:hypothetical protein [Chloroflexota bacterium]
MKAKLTPDLGGRSNRVATTRTPDERADEANTVDAVRALGC